MTIPRIALGFWCLLAVGMSAHAQPEVIAPAPAPVDQLVPVYSHEPTSPSKRWADLDPTCMPYCYAYNHLAIPFDVTLRGGPSFLVGGGRFDHVLETGFAIELIGRGFCYNADDSAAWTLGFGYLDSFHPGDDTVAAARRINDVKVESQFGAQIPTAVVSDYGIEYLHRQYIVLEGGREWYWFAADPCLRVAAGFDVGGRVGHAHAQIRLVNRVFAPQPAQNDTLIELPENHFTTIPWGILGDIHAGVFYTRWGYDIYLGVRGEISRDWIHHIVNTDDTIDQFNLMFELGVRF